MDENWILNAVHQVLVHGGTGPVHGDRVTRVQRGQVNVWPPSRESAALSARVNLSVCLLICLPRYIFLSVCSFIYICI